MNFPEHLAEVDSQEPLARDTDTVGLGLLAGRIAARLQSQRTNLKENLLKNTGYDYGDTVWGIGEGWDSESSVIKF